jgi:hypothetical protein
MICPICQKHILLQAEKRWYCPQCFHVYPCLPVYGLSHQLDFNRIKILQSF